MPLLQWVLPECEINQSPLKYQHMGVIFKAFTKKTMSRLASDTRGRKIYMVATMAIHFAQVEDIKCWKSSQALKRCWSQALVWTAAAAGICIVSQRQLCVCVIDTIIIIKIVRDPPCTKSPKE